MDTGLLGPTKDVSKTSIRYRRCVMAIVSMSRSVPSPVATTCRNNPTECMLKLKVLFGI